MIPKGIFNRIGGFDEHFWMYCEDVDLSWRVKAAGLGCYVSDRALVAHYSHNRKSDRVRDVALLRSAYILATKWGSKRFAAGIAAEASHAFGMALEAPNVDLMTSVDIRRAKPDFIHGLLFSRAIW